METEISRTCRAAPQRSNVTQGRDESSRWHKQQVEHNEENYDSCSCGDKMGGPPRHKETWWWNSEVAEAVEEKRKAFKKWQEIRSKPDHEKYKEAKRNAYEAVTKAKEEKRIEVVEELKEDVNYRKAFRIAKQMAN